MGELNAQRIAHAGLVVVDRDGPRALTIRAVASELGVTPMALYNHVANKAALMALVVETALDEHPLPEPTGRGWAEDLCAMSDWIRDSVRAHPNVSRLRSEVNLWTRSTLLAMERWMEIWQSSGLDPGVTTSAALASCLAINGLAHQELLFQDLLPPEGSSVEELPLVRTLFERRATSPITFQVVARSLIEGIHARFSAPLATSADALDGGMY